MLVYLINIALTVIWALIFNIGKQTKLKKILYVGICFLQMFLISAFRFRVGNDYSFYAASFFKMAVSGFSDMSYEDWEIGFILLNKVIGVFTAKPSVFIMITSFLVLIGPAYLIARYSVNPFISVFLYVNLYLFYLDMNFIRQAIAMSIICFAYGFLVEKKFWRFLLIVLLAATFHLTVLYMIPVFIVCLIPVSSRSHLLYLFGLLFYYILSDGMLKILLSKFHTEYSDTEFIEKGTYFYYCFFPLMICLGMVALSYFVKEKSRTLNVLIHLTLMMGFWQIVMTKHSLFERFSYYTMLFVVLAVPEGLKAFKKQLTENYTEKLSADIISKNGEKTDGSKSKSVVSKARKQASSIIGITVAAILLFAFVYNMIGLIVPKNGVHGVLPYQLQSSVGFELPSIDSFFKG